MPDICMCEGIECPLKDSCYRCTATPSEFMQSYFMTPPYKEENCEYYWKNHE